MGVMAAVCRELVAAGLAGSELVAALERVESEADAALERLQRQPVVRDEAAERRRAKDRERKSAERLRTSAESADVVSPKERSPAPPKEITPSTSLRSDNQPQARARLVQDALGAVLDDEHATAVIEHRRQLRKPLTVRAAHLLARKFAGCSDPNAAADAMIANGWQGFEPEWIEKRGGTGPPRQRSQNGFAAYVIDLADQGHDQPPDDSPDHHAPTGS
jgi:hypothetical protein